MLVVGPKRTRWLLYSVRTKALCIFGAAYWHESSPEQSLYLYLVYLRHDRGECIWRDWLCDEVSYKPPFKHIPRQLTSFFCEKKDHVLLMFSVCALNVILNGLLVYVHWQKPANVLIGTGTVNTLPYEQWWIWMLHCTFIIVKTYLRALVPIKCIFCSI